MVHYLRTHMHHGWNTRQTPSIKFDSSPTPPVVVIVTLIRFFIKHTVIPESGPILYAAIRAGSSEKSNLINDGIKGTLKLSIISTVETAPSIPVTVINRILSFLSSIDIAKSSHNNYVRKRKARRQKAIGEW